MQKLRESFTKFVKQSAQGAKEMKPTLILPATTPVTPAGPDERVKYLREILYLCKTFSAAEKERMSSCKTKTDKLNAFIAILNEIADPKVAKDASKLRAAATKHIAHFPYLKAFDLKNDIKFIATCMAKVVEHKSVKAKRYQDEYESASMRLGIADQSFKSYDKKLVELQKK